MVYITVAYGVSDFDKWRIGFNSFNEVRKAAGCLSTTVYVSPDDRNSLNVVFEWDSKENFVKFSNNPELKEAMSKSNILVTSPPMIKFWDLQTE